MRTVLLGLALSVCIGCTSPDGPDAPVVPDDWQTIKAGEAFTFKAPPDLLPEQIQGTDSFVGRYVNSGMVLSFDYGWHSDPMNREGFERTAATIDGRAAFIVKKGTTMGVHFPMVDVKTKRTSNDTKLTMYVKLNGADSKTVETIFLTIDFPE